MEDFAVHCENLSHRYDQDTLALNALSLNIPQGSFFGLLGPNGAGKTTFIDVLTSLIQTHHPNIHIFGHPLGSKEIAEMVGIVPQEFNFNIFQTVEHSLYLQAGFYKMTHKQAAPVIEKLLVSLDLVDKRDKRVSMLSGGMKRRLMIARALVHTPKLLILDEPTAGVDTMIRHDTWELLKDLNQKGMTILLTTHYLEEAEALCDEVAFIQKGYVLNQGSIETFLGNVCSKRLLLRTKEKHPSLADLPQGWRINQQNPNLIIFDVPKSLTESQARVVLEHLGMSDAHFWMEPASLEDVFFQVFKEKA